VDVVVVVVAVVCTPVVAVLAVTSFFLSLAFISSFYTLSIFVHIRVLLQCTWYFGNSTRFLVKSKNISISKCANLENLSYL
jgi:hypothetical protein